MSMPYPPTGLTLSEDGSLLFVTCADVKSRICVVDTSTSRVVEQLSAGHTAMSQNVSKDGKTLFVCNRFNNTVSLIDLASGREVRSIPVQREPVAAALTHDGKYLLVANHLQNGRSDVYDVAAVVSVIDVGTGGVVKELRLPNGSGLLNDIQISPDGKYAALTHIVAGYTRVTTRLQAGWINANGLTIIDVDRLKILGTVLLDQPDRGAANPWGLAWTEDGSKLLVTLSGVHEVSVIDFGRLIEAIKSGNGRKPGKIPSKPQDGQNGGKVLQYVTRYEGIDSGLPFLVGGNQRIKLPSGDMGPRAVTVAGNKAYVANYFSDTLTEIDLSSKELKAVSIPIGPKPVMDLVRKGEMYFHDASICFQGWQSCASCHPGGGRADGLNWDLVNDGVGSPKNTKSLLLSHKTPPAMSLGVRETAETAVRSGLKHMLFTEPKEEVALAIDEYLKSLKPVPSPHLVRGKLSESARRGEKLFQQSGCASCHPPGLFTDQRSYDVGTRRPFDKPGDKFDTPTLIEVWRTAPYLHDGSAATMRDVLTTSNKDDCHGKTSHLTPQEIDDLVEYVLSQ
jgi:YVTN family beta-propeller protein